MCSMSMAVVVHCCNTGVYLDPRSSSLFCNSGVGARIPRRLESVINILRYGCVLTEFLREDDVHLLARNDPSTDLAISSTSDLEVLKRSWSI